MLLTVAQAAKKLGISCATLYQLVATRKITHLRIGNGRGGIRFTDDFLTSYLDSCRVEPAHATVVVARKLRHLRVGNA